MGAHVADAQNKILAKREMRWLAQCVWTMWGWFCSEIIRSRCSFSPQHPSLMDPMPPDLFQGQNLCHIIHTFKTENLQKSLWLCSTNITRSHYFWLIWWESYFLAKSISFIQLLNFDQEIWPQPQEFAFLNLLDLHVPCLKKKNQLLCCL